MTSLSAPPPDRLLRQTRIASIGSVVVTLLTVPAHAEDVVELDWSAPPGCPDVSEVMDRIRSLAGGALRTKERLRATGRIERRAQRFRLTLTVEDEGSVGERTVDSDSCADLAGAAAVALGLLLENKRQEEEAKIRPDTGAPSGDDGKSATKPARPKPPAERPPDSGDGAAIPAKEDAERSFYVLAQLPLLTLDIGPLPSTSLGLGAGAGVKIHDVRVVGIGRYYAPMTMRSSSFPAASAEIRRLSAELWTGYGLRSGAFEIAPCVTGALDHYTARGAGEFVLPRTARTLVFAIGGGLAADLHVFDWLAVSATAAVRAETSRPRLVVDDLGDEGRIGRTDAVQTSFALGLTGIL